LIWNKGRSLKYKLALTPMGVLATESVHARPSVSKVKLKSVPKDAMGCSQNLLLLESFNFCELGAHAKFWNPMTTSSRILGTG
jgi:hypothetical protein